MAHVLVTGGVRSGKSRYAESYFSADAPLTYLTPGYPADPAKDPEWASRVAAHQARRPSTWRTVETLSLASELRAADGPVLVDCLGTWLTRMMDGWDAWNAETETWTDPLSAEIAALSASVKAHPDEVVLVTNEVGWGLVSEHRSGRLFADNLGRVNQSVADACDQIVLMIAGRPLVL